MSALTRRASDRDPPAELLSQNVHGNLPWCTGRHLAHSRAGDTIYSYRIARPHGHGVHPGALCPTGHASQGHQHPLLGLGQWAPGGRARRGDAAGAEAAVIRTRDGGENWEKVGQGLEETGHNFVTAIVFDEEDPNRLFMGLRSGELYASQDSGDSWTRLDVKTASISDMRCVRA